MMWAMILVFLCFMWRFECSIEKSEVFIVTERMKVKFGKCLVMSGTKKALCGLFGKGIV